MQQVDRRFLKPTVFAVSALALTISSSAMAVRPTDALPPPTWEIVGGEDASDRYDDSACIEWSEVRFPGSEQRKPDVEEDDPEVLVDENNVPILDEFGNFIGCDAAAGAGWLSGPTPYLIGAFVLAQIVIFAGGSDSDRGPSGPGGPTDSPG